MSGLIRREWRAQLARAEIEDATKWREWGARLVHLRAEIWEMTQCREWGAQPLRPWAENWSPTKWEEGNLIPWMKRTTFGNRIGDLSVTCGVVLCPGLPTHLRKDLDSPTPIQGGVPKCVDLVEIGLTVTVGVDHDPNFHLPCPELSNPCRCPCPCLFHRPCLFLRLFLCLFHWGIHFHLRTGANTNSLVQSTCTHHPNCKLLVDGHLG